MNVPVILGVPALHTIQFTGSGSEYFRIWVVNLLLTVVTLGLYYPWAKVRKLQYFYGNTLVMGHPLGFHGNPRQMLRGYLLVSALMVLYGLAGQASPISGAISACILAAVWPALMRASLQFRLSQTSWRGLRLRFTGSLRGAYMVFLRPVLWLTGLLLLGVILSAMLPRMLGGILMAVLALGAVAAFGPYALWRLKTYQHAHYELGQLRTTFRATFGDMTRIFLKTGAMTVLTMAAIGLLTSLLLPSSGGVGGLDPRKNPAVLMAWLGTILTLIVGYVLVIQVVQIPYFTAQMQNLVWTQTGNRFVRFKSHLSWVKLARLALQNWVLIILTLGLYWPFAAVANTRVRLQAIVLHSRQDPDLLIAQARGGTQDAAGEMAADLIGLDIGM